MQNILSLSNMRILRTRFFLFTESKSQLNSRGHARLGRGEKNQNSHEHKSVKILGGVEGGLDEVCAPAGLCLFASCP